MLHQSHLIPAQALSVRGSIPREIPHDIRGTRQAIFFLLRRAAVPSGQPMTPPARAPLMDADNFVFQF
jgi:hypothetical protein